MKLRKTELRIILSFLLLSLFCLSLLCGCGRNGRLTGMELSRRLLIEAIGLDADRNGITLSLLTMDTKPTKEGNETEKESGPSRFLRFTAESVGQAATLAEQTTGQIPFFAHARLLVIGKTAAEQGVSDFLDFFLRNRTVRNMIPVCVAEGTAASVLSFEVSHSAGTAQRLEKILTASHACGTSVQSPLFSFMNRILSADTEAFCPLIEKSKGKDEEELSSNGTAIFKNEKLHTVLTKEETTALLLLLDDLTEALIPLSGQTPPITCRIRETNARFRKTETTPHAFDFSLQIKAEITEADGAHYPVDERKKAQISALLQDTLAEAAASCFNKLYNGNRADLCRLQRKLHADGMFNYKKIQLRPRVSVSLG